MRVVPVSRTQERIIDDDKSVLVCYPRSCPHYYVDDKGTLNPIDLGLREKTIKTKKHHVRDRNVVSVGFRHDASHHKFIGFRPDVNQALGSEQLEFTVESVKFDGEEQPVDLSKNKAVDDLTTKLGSILVRSNRQRTRQLVEINQPIIGFAIKYTLHVKGLSVEERGGEFWFFSEADGEFRFRIRKPCLCGLDFQPLDIKGVLVEHNLIDNHDGTYTYTKTSTAEFGKTELPADYYIDADVYYSTTADGLITHQAYGVTWDDIRTSETGSTCVDDTVSNEDSVWAHQPVATFFQIVRSFFYFDTSGATNPSAVDLKVHGITNANADVSAQKGTQAASLTTADFDSFSGSEYGFNNSWTVDVYNTISFNVTGVNEIVTDGTTKICCRERDHDYLDPAPNVGEDISSGFYYADEDGTDKDPKLEITEGAAGFVPYPYPILESMQGGMAV